jgi:hypothetical protein
MQCLSCKNKNTIERCEKSALKNLLFCGIHMRSKIVRHWITFNPSVNCGIRRIQSIWRGFYVRKRLKLAGKSVLNRNLCHNDDEVVTLESKEEVHPFDYFSIEEGGKIWWFDQRTMIQLSLNSVEVKNPFTRNNISHEDMRRLRLLTNIRKKYGMQTLHSPVELTENQLKDQRWLRVIHIIYECGLEGYARPDMFQNMTKYQLKLFLLSLIEDTYRWIPQKRIKYHIWLKMLRNNIGTYTNLVTLSKDVAGTLITILNDLRDPQEFVFFILTALLKVELVAAVL